MLEKNVSTNIDNIKQKKSSIYKRVKKEVDSSKSIKKVKNKL